LWTTFSDMKCNQSVGLGAQRSHFQHSDVNFNVSRKLGALVNAMNVMTSNSGPEDTVVSLTFREYQGGTVMGKGGIVVVLSANDGPKEVCRPPPDEGHKRNGVLGKPNAPLHGLPDPRSSGTLILATESETRSKKGGK
jgi:hypothetical protein